MPISVKLNFPKKRSYFLAQWEDPITGKIKTRSTKTKVRREADRFAGRLEDELNAGTYKPKSHLTWKELVDRYLKEVSVSKARKTKYKMEGMNKWMVELIDPKYAHAVNADVISSFQSKLRDNNLKEPTIHGHLREVRKLLRWATKLELIPKTPHIEFPTVVPAPKGRAITGEELDRFIAAIPKVVVIPEFVASWEYLATGLWWSGLRIEEAMLMEWSNDEFLCPDFTGRRPQFRIQAISEKGRAFRMLPMAPEFAEFLLATPEKERHGFIFNPLTRPPHNRNDTGKGSHRPTASHAGKVLSKIGKAAKIKVSTTKDASAHDFRRAFGTRWAQRVFPLVLMEMMRHDDIETTQDYYLSQKADDTADAVWNSAWRQSTNTSANTSQNHGVSDHSQDATDSTKQGISKYPREDSNL